MYISINKLYAQNPVFEIVREESVKVYLRMYNGNVQQNLQRVELCLTNSVFEIVQESVKVCTTGMSSVCVCVFFPSILDIKFVGRTSRGHTGGRSHRIFNPPSFCGACLDFCREKDSAIPFPRRR